MAYENLPNPYLKALRYTDDSLKKFFEEVQKEKYFSNTLFVITADHAYSQQGLLANHQIPLLFYFPQDKHLRGENHNLCSQLEFMPSLLHLLGYDEAFSAFGQNLFSPNLHYVVFGSDALMVFLQKDFALLLNGKTPQALYDFKKDPFSKTNLLFDKKEILSSLLKDYLIYISLMNSSIIKNEITAPSS